MNKITEVCHILEYVAQDSLSTSDIWDQILFLLGAVLFTVGS